MVVYREFANRSICMDYIQGRLCKFDGWEEGGCWYSHTLVDMERLEGITGELDTSSAMSIRSTVIEHFGKAGWRITLNFTSKAQAPAVFQHTRLDLAISEARKAVKKYVTPSMAAAYAAKRVHNPRKPMTFCGNYMLGGLCPRGNSCWNSHSLVDTARIDRIAGNPKYSAHKPLVSITRDHSGLWEVALRARFIDKTLRTLGTPIYACCDTLHDALTSVENKCISGTLDYLNEAEVPPVLPTHTGPVEAPRNPPPPYTSPLDTSGDSTHTQSAPTTEADPGWIELAINIAIPLLALALGYKSYSRFRSREPGA